uniref:Calponin family repeat-containing domain protein n=1 Tax=Meloidogyne incognita TaxID=6306 RepID=A0A914LZX4_MELIC
MQAGTNKFETQRGMTAPGMPRLNITKDKKLGYIEPDRKSEEFLRPQCGTNLYASQAGQTPIGANRNQANLKKYILTIISLFSVPMWNTKRNNNWNENFKRNEWETILEKEGEGILPKQSGDYGFATQAGEVNMGAPRNQVPNIRGRLPNDRRTHGLLCYQYGTNIFASQQGMLGAPGLGAFRQATQDIDGLGFTEENIRASSEFTPWYSGQNKFASQKGTGGFLKVRDVLPHTTGGKEIPEDSRLKSEGIVPLQSGTNKLASQKGMTGFGTPRNTMTRMGWKKEWVEEYEAAMREWEENRPPGSASAGSDTHPFEKYKRKFEERESSKLSDSGDSAKVETKPKEEEKNEEPAEKEVEEEEVEEEEVEEDEEEEEEEEEE